MSNSNSNRNSQVPINSLSNSQKKQLPTSAIMNSAISQQNTSPISANPEQLNSNNPPLPVMDHTPRISHLQSSQVKQENSQMLNQTESFLNSQAPNPVLMRYITPIQPDEVIPTSTNDIIHLQNSIRAIFTILNLNDQIINPLNSLLNGQGSLNQLIPNFNGIGN